MKNVFHPICWRNLLPGLFLLGASYLLAGGIVWWHAGNYGRQEQEMWMREAGLRYACQVRTVMTNAYESGNALRALLPDLLLQEKSSPQVERHLNVLLSGSRSLCGVWVLRASEDSLQARLLTEDLPGKETPAPAAKDVVSPTGRGAMPQRERSLFVYRLNAAQAQPATLENDLYKLQYAYTALAQNSDVISSAYHDRTTGQTVVSIVLLLPGKERGVLGVDVPVDNLFQIVRDFDRHVGYSSLIGDDFLFLAHSYKADLPEQSVRRIPMVRTGIEALRTREQYEYYGPSLVGREHSFKVYSKVALPVAGRYWSVNLILQRQGLSDWELSRFVLPYFAGGLALAFVLALCCGWLLLRRTRRTVEVYRRILDAAQMPVLATDEGKRVLYLNDAARRIARAGPAGDSRPQRDSVRLCHEMLGWQLAGGNQCPLDRLQRFGAGRSFVQVQDREYEVEAGYLGSEKTGVKGFFTIFYNRSDLRYLEAVIDAEPQGILLVDAENCEVIGVNRSALQMYGVTGKERLIGRRLQAGPGAGEARLRTDELDPVEGLGPVLQPPLHLVKSVRRAQVGGRDSLVISLQDITAQKQAEEQLSERNRELEKLTESLQQKQSQLLQQEKMASIGQLAAGVAHEINNPVGFVGSNLHTLLDYLRVFQRLFELCDGFLAAQGDPQKVRELTAQLEQIAREEDIRFILEDAGKLADESIDGMNRVRDIVKNLKSFARPDTEGSGEVDLNEQLRVTLKMTNNELKYRCVVVEEYADLPRIPGRAGELNQVFLNLITNAAAAIAGRGTITVRTFLTADGKAGASVSDTGCGITPENMSRLFDPFFTTKEIGKGTGLGLFISHGIVEKHGGEIRVESTPGQGATFTVLLPLEKGNA